MARRRTGKHGQTISPAAVDAFRRGDRDGLYAALDMRPWSVNPLDAGPVPAHLRQPGFEAQRDEHEQACDLRRRLEAAVAESG